jgi:excisionase family DNA binding protein
VSRDEKRTQLTGEGEWLTSSELQAWLGLGRTTIFALLNDPDQGIPNYRIGRKIIIRRRDVENWLEQNRYGTRDSQ